MNDVIKIENLKTYFNTKDGVVKAVDDLSLSIKPGHTLGVVGESGSGKSVTSLTIMNLLAASAEIYDGSISFLGKDLINISAKDMRELRGSDVSMIFQEPMSSLNPVHRVGDQVAEAILQHEDIPSQRQWSGSSACLTKSAFGSGTTNTILPSSDVRWPKATSHDRHGIGL